MKAIVHLKWKDATHTAIRKILSLSYEVENTSTISVQSTVRTQLSSTSPNDGDSRIESLELGSLSQALNVILPSGKSLIIDSSSPRSFGELELKDLGIVKWEANVLEVMLKLDLSSRQVAHVKHKQTTIEKTEDNCAIICKLPTVGLDVQVNPEPGIAVEHTFLHPSGKVLRSDDEILDLKVASAVLPYQGIEFSWHPSAPEVPAVAAGDTSAEKRETSVNNAEVPQPTTDVGHAKSVNQAEST